MLPFENKNPILKNKNIFIRIKPSNTLYTVASASEFSEKEMLRHDVHNSSVSKNL